MRNLIFAIALLAGACGQTTTPETPAPSTTARAEDLPIPTDPAAGPSGADSMTWRFTRASTPDVGTPHARLMYTSNGSEGMALNLQCDGGTMYARLWRGRQRETWPFSLQSGTARADLSGTTEGESEVTVTATLPLTATVLTTFRSSGRITLIDGDVTQVLDAINAQERRAIEGFFDACS